MKTMVSPARPVLLVDDEPHILFSYSALLKVGGLPNVLTCQEPRQVLEMMKGNPVELVLLDLIMPHCNGGELLEKIVEEHPDIPVVVITGLGDVETAVRCMKIGAFEYLVKPISEERLLTTVRGALKYREMQREINQLRDCVLKDELHHPDAFSDIITQNPRMLALFQYIESVGQTGQPVLITGETGVGKDLFARVIHEISGRSGDFVRVNVGGLDDNLLADSLFGHVRGAFTGADRDRPGLIERAAGGTLFLDEIGDISPLSQVKLLGLLQYGEYLPLGQDEPRYTDTRVVVATNRDLRVLREDGRFRKDLYYRLMTHQIHIPPLRERTEDLPILVEHFVAFWARDQHRPPPPWPNELISLLKTYHFPGNVRELKAMIDDALSSMKGRQLSREPFLKHIGRERFGSEIKPDPEQNATIFSNLPHLPTIKQATDLLVQEALKRADGNLTAASQLLGITRQGLSKRLSRS